MKEQLKQAIKKYTLGELSLKEEIELSEQLADEQNTSVNEYLYEDWIYQLEKGAVNGRNFKPLLDRVHHQIRINEPQIGFRTRFIQTFQRIAAILIIPLMLSFVAYFYFHPEKLVTPTSYAEIQCPLGVRTKFILPDGSTGFLNSGSRLKYPVQFIGERKVELSGEAFFDVVHNKEIPFHVNTRNLDIKVLGTTFNVIANEDELTEEIVLQTGKVDVSSKDGKQTAVIVPNDLLTLDIEKQIFTKRVVNASQYTSWKDGKLEFRNENMQQVARRLSRWYNAEVVVDDPLLDKYTFHATFIDEPLDEVLKLLTITTPISFHEEKRVSDKEGVFQKRKIILDVNHSKINQFR